MATADVMARLQRRQQLEERKDRLIEKVEDLVKEKEVPVPANQLQNVLRLVLSTVSVNEVRLFIRYQCARHKEWRDFGPQLIRLIEEVAGEAQDDHLLKIELVRLFLGYLVREAHFRKLD